MSSLRSPTPTMDGRISHLSGPPLHRLRIRDAQEFRSCVRFVGPPLTVDIATVALVPFLSAPLARFATLESGEGS